MKQALIVGLLLLVVLGTAPAQFKSQTSSSPGVSSSIVRQDDGGLLFGWFDPGKLIMRQSYSLSYMTSGGHNLSLGVYTNSLSYQISDPLSVQFDVSLMHSPYNNLGSKVGSDLTGLYLTRAQLNYRPSENTMLQLQFRQLPSMYYLNNDRSWGMFGPSFMLEEDPR
jgi:hypothetical protein